MTNDRVSRKEIQGFGGGRVLRRFVLTFFFGVLWSPATHPATARAQVDTGTTAAGLFYEISGSGPPVVLIHAFSLDRRMWQPQLDALQRGFKVIRYDLRGHGRSVAPLKPYAAYEDLRGVLDALGIERAALVGLSAGAQIATDFALVYPERVTRLLLASPGLGGFVPKEPLTWFQPVAEAARAGNIDLATRLWAATPLMAIRNNPGASLVSEIVAGNARVWSYRANPERTLTPPAIERLDQIRCPVLVVLGDDDLPLIKEVGEILATRIPGAAQLRIQGAGHLVNIMAPESFNAALLAFLRPDRVAPTGQDAAPSCRQGL